MAAPDDDEVAPRRPARAGPWIVLGVVAVLVAGAIFGLVRLASRPLPDRVAVAVHGCGERCNPDLANAVAQGLSRAGLEGKPLALTSGDVAREREAARELRAGYVIDLGVEPVLNREGLSHDRTFVVARATARLYAADGDARIVAQHSVTTGMERETVGAALYAMGTSFAEMLFPDMVQALFARPDVKDAVDSQRGIEGFARTERVDRSRRALDARARIEAEYRRACAVEARGLAALERTGMHCVTPACAEEYAVGVLPDGSAAVVQVGTPSVVFPFAPDSQPTRYPGVERIDLVPLPSGARRTLATAQRVYGYPALSENGATVVYVESTSDSYGLVAIDLASGDRRVLHVTRRPERMQDPKLSPDGARVLVTARIGADGPPRLLVSSTAGGGTHVLAEGLGPSRWVTLATAPGGTPRPLIAAYVRPDAPTTAPVAQDPSLEAATSPIAEVGTAGAPGEAAAAPPRTWPTRPYVRVIDPDSGVTVARVGGDQHSVVDVSGSRHGELFVEWDDGDQGCGIGRFDSATGQTSWLPMATCAANLAVAADGVLVGEAIVSRPGDASGADAEIATVDPATGAVAPLTASETRERYVRTARDGRRFIFERVAPSSYRGLPGVAVCSMQR